jgi:hypothetical protein
MNDIQNRQRLNEVLRDLAEELDVPPSKYEEAKQHYDAVGDWLGEDDTELAPYEPVIYPQGSFALGTAVRPLGNDDYDVDAVCLLQLGQNEITQQQLKAMVGNRLKHPHSRYKDMLDPKEGGRRCWTIKYTDTSKFHLDVLPAIPDDYERLIAIGVPNELAKYAICITDRKTWDIDVEWPKSNPKGYIEWFKNRMRVRLEEARRIVAMAERAEVHEIEDFKVRTPLQQLIQLLKRHRDVRYNGDEDKPISIIITTLAAQGYNNESDLGEAIVNVVPCMRNAIENRNGVLWVANPVNPLENFADKWTDKPRKQMLFFEWLDAVEREHKNLLTDRGFEKVGEYLAESYGRHEAKATMVKYASSQTGKDKSVAAASVILIPSQSNLLNKAAYQKIDLSKPSKPWMF